MVCVGGKGSKMNAKVSIDLMENDKYYFVTLVETKQQLIERNHEGKSMSFLLTSNEFFNAVTEMSPVQYLHWLKVQPVTRMYRIVSWQEISKQEHDDWVDDYGFLPL